MNPLTHREYSQEVLTIYQHLVYEGQFRSSHSIVFTVSYQVHVHQNKNSNELWNWNLAHIFLDKNDVHGTKTISNAVYSQAFGFLYLIADKLNTNNCTQKQTTTGISYLKSSGLFFLHIFVSLGNGIGESLSNQFPSCLGIRC